MELYESTKLALQASNEVLQDRIDIVGPFQRLVSNGISANLCEALAQAGGENRIPFEVSFNWAQHRPAPFSRKMYFGADNLRVLGEAAKQFRDTEPEVGVTIQGFVVKLARESEQGPKLITIAGAPTGGLVDRVGHYWVELPTDEYSQAVRAHFDDQRVSIRGDIVKRGNRRWVSGSSDFSVFESSE
jgi:hypothetical protein